MVTFFVASELRRITINTVSPGLCNGESKVFTLYRYTQKIPFKISPSSRATNVVLEQNSFIFAT
jgi:hypothetical protein